MEEEASEVERELLDGAGELLTATARVDPGGVIQHGMTDILEASVLLMKKPDPGSKACALGILADLFDTIGSNSCEGFVKQLLPAYINFTSAEDDNIRNNATYGIGVLVNTGGATGAAFIQDALKALPINEAKNKQVRVCCNMSKQCAGDNCCLMIASKKILCLGAYNQPYREPQRVVHTILCSLVGYILVHGKTMIVYV